MDHYKDLERIATLLLLDQNSLLNDQEKIELQSWKASNPILSERALQLLSGDELPNLVKKLEAADITIRKKLQKHDVPVSREDDKISLYVEDNDVTSFKFRHIFSAKWLRYTAVFVILVTSGIFLLLHTPVKPDSSILPDVATVSNDIPAGGDKATLTLADGTKIILDSLNNGPIGREGDVSIIKLTNGELKYEEERLQIAEPVTLVSNTITTPNAGQYSLTLPDGSRVWLNAASSMTFPAHFDQRERRVSITGEVYFEIAKDVARPFIVQINNQSTVEVLGTHFNINAYVNEPSIKTTLLEGKVKLIKGQEERRLLPGEQAIIKEEIKLAKQVNIDQVIAWKNGLFNFDNVDLPELMRQIERWYDIKMTFRGDVPAIKFKGKMYRSENLSNVLNFLKDSGLDFKIEGKTVTVKKG